MTSYVRLHGLRFHFAGQFDLTITQYRAVLDLNRDFVPGHWHLGWALEQAGRHDEARTILDQLNEESALRHVSAYHIALIHGALGDIDAAFQWLDEAVNERSPWIGTMAVDPRIGTLRQDSRLDLILQRADLVL